MLSLGVLVSGNGSNLQAILDVIAGGGLNATVRVVISNKPGVLALERAKAASVPTRCLSHRDYGTREEFDGALVRALREASVEWVVLAGFMRLLTPTMIGAFPGKIVNIHPALLPAFPGTEAPAQAFHYGVKIAGCTVHLVDEGTDTGPIVAQRAVPVLEADDALALKARILDQEHELLVEVLRAISEGRVEVMSRDGERPRVRVRPR
jgi:phosphoribosylglycinamide formyltransferase-1